MKMITKVEQEQRLQLSTNIRQLETSFSQQDPSKHLCRAKRSLCANRRSKQSPDEVEIEANEWIKARTPELEHVLHSMCKGIWASVSLAASCSENMAVVWLLWICKYWIWQGNEFESSFIEQTQPFHWHVSLYVGLSAREGWRGWHTEGITQPRTQNHTNGTHV